MPERPERQELSLTDISSPSIHARMCSACGYSLQGLAEQGLCPECGNSFSDECVVLWGWPLSPLLIRINRSPRWRLVLLIAIILFGFTCIAWILFLLGMFRHFLIPSISLWIPAWSLVMSLAALLIQVGVAIQWFLTLYFEMYRHQNPARPSMQVLVCAAGFAWRWGPGRTRLKPWRPGYSIQLKHLRENLYGLRVGGYFFPRANICFESDPQAAERLRMRIEGWIRAANHPEE